MPFDQQRINSDHMNLPETPKRIGCSDHFVLVLTILLGLLGGCASKPELPPAPEAVSRADKDIFAEPDFPRLIRNVENQHGPVAGNRIRHWATLVERGKTLGTHERLVETNRFFNGAQFLTDQEIWQTDDYWATPAEFLIKDAGDCEEFAIAKYFTLRFMGLEDSQMRITYVKALSLDQPHMVLAYYTTPTGEPVILDNINPRILPSGQRQDLIPVYSFNGKTLWLARSRNEQVPSGDPQQLGLWQQLIERMQRQLPSAPP